MYFWDNLRLKSGSSHPIIGLSPMDGVTDHPFRHITKKYGHPDVMYTEFTSVEGVCHGATALLKDFLYDESQRPIVGQIYGTTPDFFRQTAIALCQLGFDGIDINMGCPAKNVAHSGAGAALIKTPKLAQEIIRSVQQGIREWQEGATVKDCTNISEEIRYEVLQRHSQLPKSYQVPRPLPVSVKTRIGYDIPVIDDWIPTLLETGIQAIALHGRTLKQQYSGSANWELIGQAAQIVRSARNIQNNTQDNTFADTQNLNAQRTHQSQTLLLGNGDIASRSDALEKISTFQLDGALIGRASFGNPFVFLKDLPTDATAKLFDIAYEHAYLYEQTYAHHPTYHFLPMRKHLGWYVHDIPNAAQIRVEIYQTNTAEEFRGVLRKYGLV